MPSLPISLSTTPLSLLAALAFALATVFIFQPSSLISPHPFDATSTSTSPSPTAPVSDAMTVPISSPLKRMPAYFISHGGPPTLFDSQSAAYLQWVSTGKEIKALNPRGLVVVSAHWENDRRTADVLINEVSKPDLIYDFGGFPRKFYEQTFHAASQPWLVELVKAKLTDGGVGVKGVGGAGRGFDHGAWVPFKVFFPDHSPSEFPIVQVSLPGDSSAESSIKLGLALSKLRDEGIVVVGSGQPVHNLRDFFTNNTSAKYGEGYRASISSLVASPARLSTAADVLTKHPAYKRAHPTPEHLLPLFVAMGAGGDGSTGTILHDSGEGALGWGFYRFD